MSGTPWTPSEDQQLVELLSLKKHSFNQMARLFSTPRTGTSLRKRALSKGLTNHGFIFFKHSYNRAFFSVPNPVNCYVAGYYAADGHIADNPTTRLLSMELSHLEWHQLETFKRLIEYTGDVQDSSYPYHPEMCALRLYSAYEITADLERHFGLTPRKTHRLPAPNLTDPHLQLCYLAGLLDGDGCVCISNTNQLTISYVSSSCAIAVWVQLFVESLNLRHLRNKAPGKVRPVCNGTNAFTYSVSGLKAIDLIRRVQALKLEGIPILDRKWDNPRLNEYIAAFEASHGLPPSVHPALAAPSTSSSPCPPPPSASPIQPFPSLPSPVSLVSLGSCLV